jgi:DNA-binding transcriptional ArsR family regulator
MRSKLKHPLKDSAKIFAALGDETRLKLVSTLCDLGPLSISRLAEGHATSRQAITKHLETLKEAKLIHVVPKGREKIWDLDEKRLQIAKDYLELISRSWDEKITALKTLVED